MTADVAILLVEDNPDHRELIMLALREVCDPSRIVTAADGDDALDYLFGRGAYQHVDAIKQPRLVILDLKLKTVHGLEVLKQMRASLVTQWTPVVMLSASTEKAELDACYQAGANSVVRKTADFEDMRRKMKQVYGFWVMVNEANRNSRV